MGIKELVLAILSEDVNICKWKITAEQEKKIAEDNGYKLLDSDYYKLGCYNCDGLNIDCQYSPNNVKPEYRID